MLWILTLLLARNAMKTHVKTLFRKLTIKSHEKENNGVEVTNVRTRKERRKEVHIETFGTIS